MKITKTMKDNITVRVWGYKIWKTVKEENGMFKFYFLPTVMLSYDDAFDDDLPYEILIAWLFWRIYVHFKFDRNK